MPDEKPRPTRALVDDLEGRLASAMTALTDATGQLGELTRDRDAWRDAHAPDLEAEAIAGCVRAIDEMRSGGRAAVHANRGMAYMGEAVAWTPPRPQDTSEGRILLNLAARYGVALVPAPEPEPVTAGQRLVSMPAHLAEQVERLVVADRPIYQ